MRRPQPGLPAQVNWTAYVCEHCNEYHTLDDELTTDFPSIGVHYWGTAALDAGSFALSPACCDEDDEVEAADDSDLPPAPPPPQVVPPVAPPPALDFAEELVPAVAAASCAAGAFCVRDARRWFVYPDRPPHVPALAWSQLASATRAQHRRWLLFCRGLPAADDARPLAAALVDGLLRIATDRGWRWSTLASSMSCAASALAALPLYTQEAAPVAVRSDPLFSACLRRALQNSKVARTTTVTTPAQREALEVVIRQLDPAARLFAQLLWSFAARAGDMRQVHPADVQVDDRYVTLTYRRGKAAAFWGPTAVRSVIDEDIRRRLRTHLAGLPRDTTTIFSLATQATLSRALRPTPFCLRSIRRGSLLELAAAGVTDERLCLLSGHKRLDTLRRYLGWGAASATQTAAADERHRLLGGGWPTTRPGLHAGTRSARGQRTTRPPPFAPISPPSAKELGLREVVAPADWPLHAKPVPQVSWGAILALAASAPPELAAAIATCERLCNDPHSFPVAGSALAPHQIPLCRFRSAEDVAELVRVGKLVPFSGTPHAWCTGWLLPQPRKQRYRPIFEPCLNKLLPRSCFPPLAYASRQERQRQLLDHPYVAELDFAGWFDQFGLPPAIASLFVVRAPTSAGSSLFSLGRLPMGATWAPAVAQHVTWLLVLPLLGQPDVTVVTMIDNVRIAARSARALQLAMATFLARAASIGAQLNEDIVRWHPEADAPFGSLGERFVRVDGTLLAGIADNHRDNLSSALALFLDHTDHPYTRRQFAALMGLSIFCAGSCQLSLARGFRALRVYVAVSRLPSPWDAPVDFTPSAVDAVREWVQLVLNTPDAVVRPPAPCADTPYDVVAIIDASALGWGAIVAAANAPVVELQAAWPAPLRHSATAEPTAACRVLEWVKTTHPSARRIALVTDHSALWSSQRDAVSGLRGFSTAQALNEAHLALQEFESAVFFVAGVANPADGPSRSVVPGRTSIRSRPFGGLFPSLRTFLPPPPPPVRLAWQV